MKKPTNLISQPDSEAEDSCINTSKMGFSNSRLTSPNIILNSDLNYAKTILIPPAITVPSTLWRKAVPLFYKNPDTTSKGISVKSYTDSKIQVKTTNPSQFHLVQKAFLIHKIYFHTYHHHEDCQHKVILRCIPNDASINKVKSELEYLDFEVKMVKRYETESKPISNCLVIFTGVCAKHFFDVTGFFYFKITVETFRKTWSFQ